MKVQEDYEAFLALPGLSAALDDVATGLRTALVGSEELVRPSLRVVEGGGKRLRPILLIAAARASQPAIQVSPLDRRVLKSAVAAELVHVGSLVHDDIMDKAATRRKVPTVNSVEGVNQALLVGDFLLARAGIEAASVSRDVALALAETISDLCVGQSLESLFVDNPLRSFEDTVESIKGKTGALMRAAAAMGALSVERQDLFGALAEYGMNFGIAFQLIDDILDLTSTETLMFKPVNADVRQGLGTVPAIFAAESLGIALSELLPPRPVHAGDAVGFQARVLKTDAVERTLNLIREYNRKAATALETMPDSATRDGLAGLPALYLSNIVQTKAPAIAHLVA